MVDTFSRCGYDGAGWNIVLTASDWIGFYGAAGFNKGISPGTYQGSTHMTDTGSLNDVCTPLHMRNTRYVSLTEVSLQEAAAVDLLIANVAPEDCTLRWMYWDTLGNTSLENVYLFAYDYALGPMVTPTGMRVLAFEYQVGAPDVIFTDRLSDAPLDGGAWDDSKGIGISTNALICSERAVAAVDHTYYFGLSVTVTSKGLKTAKIRWEADAY